MKENQEELDKEMTDAQPEPDQRIFILIIPMRVRGYLQMKK